MSGDPFDHARRQAAAQEIRDFEEGRAGKLLKLAADWLTTESNDELLQKVDRTLGTNLRDGICENARMPLHVDDENRVSRRREPVPSSASTPEVRAEVIDHPATDGPIVIVKARRAPTCGTCRGHGALEFDEETRQTRPIACPDCGTKPKKSAR